MLSDEGHGPVAQDDRVREVRPLVRLYASNQTHRLLPARVALAIAGALGSPWPGERRDAERLMEDLLLYTPRAGEARAMARRYLREKARVRELVWRPWLLKRSRVIGKEHWDAAHTGGRGCVIVVGHMGATFAGIPILARHGYDFYAVGGAHYWQPMPPGFIGLLLLQLRRVYSEKPLGNHRLIPSTGRPERLIELLESGASIYIAFDVAGSAATPFLGRSVPLSGGPATIAFRTGAQVLPMIPERHGTRIDLRLFEPLDPANYSDVLSLRVAIARIFEQLVLEKPQIVEVAQYPSPLVSEALASPAAQTG